jgi:hypothetical protein
MTAAIALLREVNPRARVVLTVSPVPLMATAEDRHVLVSTTYSKSVLRVAAEMLTGALSDVFYFPSYEIVTGNYTRGSYFADDLRSVREEGVQHVMSLFLRHATSDGTNIVPAAAPLRPSVERSTHEAFMAQIEEVVEVLCDEELLDQDGPRAARQARG